MPHVACQTTVHTLNASFPVGPTQPLVELLVVWQSRARERLFSRSKMMTGKSTPFPIPNSLYIPRLPLSLLSPQHWAQEAQDNIPLQNGTRMENFANGCKLIWNQLNFAKTVPFDAATHTTVFCTAPSTCSYCAFLSSAGDIDHAYYQTEVTKPHLCHAPGPYRQ